MPPALGWWPPPNVSGPGKGYGICWLFLLPYIEQDSLCKSAFDGTTYAAANNGVYTWPVKLYLCPSDPSVEGNGVVTLATGTVWGAMSYGTNLQIDATCDQNGFLYDAYGDFRLPTSVPDGSSNTVYIGEKYAHCTNAIYREGGSLWSYWLSDATMQPWHPAYVIGVWNSYSVGPSSKFQVRPHPYLGNCDPTLASTPHIGGMNVAMVDGSVRVLSPEISGQVWWALHTPRGGEPISDDAW
jgi:prepilin-type processing-associated H-X9-DG protein